MTKLAIVDVPSCGLITRLPVDVLHEIFMIVRDRDIVGICLGQWNLTAPERLSAVSSSWRQAVFQMPLLWNTVHLDGLTGLSICLNERYHRHLELSKDLPVDIIISTESTFQLASYLFHNLPMERMRRVIIRPPHPDPMRLTGYVNNTVEFLQELHKRSQHISSMELYMTGQSFFGAGSHPQVLQFNIVANRGVNDLDIRMMVQEVNMSAFLNGEPLLVEVRRVGLSNVTHFNVISEYLVGGSVKSVCISSFSPSHESELL